MTPRSARERVAYLVYLLFEGRVLDYPHLYPPWATAADKELIDDAVAMALHRLFKRTTCRARNQIRYEVQRAIRRTKEERQS